MTTDAIALIGAANFELNMRRREQIKPELNEDYKNLCLSSVPFTDSLFGNVSDLSKQLKDLAEATKVSREIRRDSKGDARKPHGNRKLQKYKTKRVWLQTQSRATHSLQQAFKREKAQPPLSKEQGRKEEAEIGPEFISLIFLRLKKNGVDYRMILNLKELNKFVVYRHFKTDSLKSVTDLMTQGCFMASVDIKDAYDTVPVANEHQKYLKFSWRDKLYQFTSLPNGLASAPQNIH